MVGASTASPSDRLHHYCPTGAGRDVSKSPDAHTKMKKKELKEQATVAQVATDTECRAELIFYARNQSKELRSVQALGEYACDFRRPDWNQRWSDWNNGRNPYLNLFLCAKHARELGLK